MKYNLDIRQRAEENAVMLWQVADGLGVADATLSRWLRKELPSETKQKVFAIIDRIAKDREEA